MLKDFLNTLLQLGSESEDRRAVYAHSLKIYRDNINTLNSATEKAWAGGKEAGLIEGKRITAIEMKADGIPLSKIAHQYTGLSEDDMTTL